MNYKAWLQRAEVEKNEQNWSGRSDGKRTTDKLFCEEEAEFLKGQSVN